MTKIKAILFDMDGVLIDAKEWHYEALNEALELFGYKIQRDDHLSTYDGLPTRDKLKLLGKIKGLPSELHETINSLKQRYTQKRIWNHCRARFDHQIAMSKLKSNGYKIAVCSNSIAESLGLMMKLSELDQYLDVSLSNEDVSSGKPDPEIYVKAMNLLGVLPHETLILEDNDHGKAAARGSGGFLMEIGDVSDVTYNNILDCISRIEGKR
jgi:HAD superfamily hydrolase (TIGR01509 family)